MRPYRISAAQSIALQMRTRSVMAAPATRSAALTAHGDGYPASASPVDTPVTAIDTPVNALRIPVCSLVAKPLQQAKAASPGSAVRRFTTPVLENRRRSAHGAAVPQAPFSSQQLAAASDASADAWSEHWVRSNLW